MRRDSEEEKVRFDSIEFEPPSSGEKLKEKKTLLSGFGD